MRVEQELGRMVSISVRRDSERERFDGRAAYYREGPARTQASARFCNVLEKGSSRTIRRVPEGAADAWRDFPWLTLVIGSGCLDIPDDPRLDPTLVARAVADAVRRIIDEEGDARAEPFATDKLGTNVFEAVVASDFATALVMNRVHYGGQRRSPAAGLEPPQVSPQAARLVLLAASLTRFYFTAKALGAEPLSRWDDDLAQVVMRDQPDLEPIIHVCQWHCEQAKAEFQGALPPGITQVMAPAIENLLEEIQRCIGQPGANPVRVSVTLLHLRLVTEVAWYLMTVGAGAYPGWTELLFGLMLREGPSRTDHIRPRPVLLRRQSRPIVDLLEPATLASWRQADISSQRNEFYAAASRVLWSQSKEILRQVNTQLPPASAFVTSFDLELEMAMWRAAPQGSSYFVVVPVHVFEGAEDDLARPCWLRGEIEKDEDVADALSCIRAPKHWEVLTSLTTDEQLRRGPHIVHLSGGPLLHLPGSPEDQRDVAEIRGDLERIWSGLLSVRVNIAKDEMVLEHAVTTDEYLALRQAEVELILSSSESPDHADKSNRALPAFLSSSNAGGVPNAGQNPRFWMAVGVPISDPAIRHRLVSQLSPKRPMSEARARVVAPRNGAAPAATAVEDILGLDEPVLLDAADGDDSAAGAIDRTVTGVIVNRRVSDDEAHILYWMGFDVVRDSAASFTADLLHYATHVRRGGRAHWPLKDVPCDLEDAEAVR